MSDRGTYRSTTTVSIGMHKTSKRLRSRAWPMPEKDEEKPKRSDERNEHLDVTAVTDEADCRSQDNQAKKLRNQPPILSRAKRPVMELQSNTYTRQ